MRGQIVTNRLRSVGKFNSNARSSDEYRTVRDFKRMEVSLKNSRFIASTLSVDSEEKAKEFIEKVSKEFHDAHHHCYAYRVGLGKRQKFRFSDAGEPSGTGGRPIYEVIDQRRLTNLVVVVSRYFGGVELGTGGLARAYRQSALSVLDHRNTQIQHISTTLSFSYPFEFTSVVHRSVSLAKARILENLFGEVPSMRVEIRASKAKILREKLLDATNGQINFLPKTRPAGAPE
jgi:uncharacterized YigZ family protein